MQPIPVFLPRKFHGQRSWQATVHGIPKESDKTQQLNQQQQQYSYQNNNGGTSIVVQWLKIHFPMQGVWVESLVWELRFHMLHDQNKSNSGIIHSPDEVVLKSGSKASSVAINQEMVRNASPQTCRIRNSKLGPAICVLIGFPSDSDACLLFP